MGQIGQYFAVHLDVALLDQRVGEARVGQAMLARRCRDGSDPVSTIVPATGAPVSVSELLSTEHLPDGHAEAVLGATAEALCKGKYLLATPVCHN